MESPRKKRRMVAAAAATLSELILLFSSPNNCSASLSGASKILSSPFQGTDRTDVIVSSSSTLLLHLLTWSHLAVSLSVFSHLPTPQSATSSPSSSSSRKRKRRPLTERSSPRSSSVSVLLPALDSFPSFFNMTSPTFEWLSGLLEPLLDCRDPAGFHLNLSAHLRLAIGLFRLATGSSYHDISSRFGVSLPTARFCTKQLCRVLCTNFRFWLAFPSPSDLLSASADFENLTLHRRLPNCCGVLTCAYFDHFSEDQPPIAAQIVVDSSTRILSITAGYRGNKGAAEVLRASSLYKDVTGGELLNSPPDALNGVSIPQYLMGNGANYPLLQWLMVPFVDPAPGSCEEDFNAAHRSICRPALMTVASLKMWGILSRPIQEEINMAVACIGACAILHNMLLTREDHSALSGAEDYATGLHISEADADSCSGEEFSDNAALGIRSALAACAKGLRTRSRLLPFHP